MGAGWFRTGGRARPEPSGRSVRGGALAGLFLAAAAGVVWASAGSARSVVSPGHAPTYRYIVDSGPDQAAAARHGWNLLDVSSKEEADTLPRGTRGLVWVGDYDNSTCRWEVSDAELRRRLAGMAADARIAGFYISDEPDPYACPSAPAQHRARSALIHSLVPRAFTFMVVDSNSGAQTLSQMRLWGNATDYVGLDPYPCRVGAPCDYGWITSVIRAADRAGLRYFGVVQAFAGEAWRWPTPAEERHMLAQWSASHEAGYMTFAWRWGGHDLASRPALLAVLERFNRTAAHAGHRAAPRSVSHASSGGTVDEVHYTYASATSVVFDWRGSAATIRYGRTRRYAKTATAHAPSPLPFSSGGPFREARLTGLAPGATYHYAIGGGPDRTFATAPTGEFRFDVEGDIGASTDFSPAGVTQRQIAADRPRFVLAVGDLTYGNAEGQASVDRHFDDVMAWSRTAAYMPAWGNHEWDEPTDDLRNYKGRFAIPHPSASPGAPSRGCCGEDWGWFDAGPVRFISYPEPYTDATWQAWRAKAAALMAAAERNPRIRFIVTFGHRPAYSTGYHHGEEQLASILDAFGDRYPKYVLNLNGHSHDYERFRPIHHVVHITAGSAGSLETPWQGADSRSAFRAMHTAHLRIDVTRTALRVAAICGAPTGDDDTTCAPGSVLDSTTIPASG